MKVYLIAASVDEARSIRAELMATGIYPSETSAYRLTTTLNAGTIQAAGLAADDIIVSTRGPQSAVQVAVQAAFHAVMARMPIMPRWIVHTPMYDLPVSLLATDVRAWLAS